MVVLTKYAIIQSIIYYKFPKVLFALYFIARIWTYNENEFHTICSINKQRVSFNFINTASLSNWRRNVIPSIIKRREYF